ncbi:MAG TPA: DoxX family protein [Burkholderiales bacterium]|nr:DoxX family protein [Burkholderiales bacterium]
MAEDAGKLVLRVTLGVLVLLHGIAKVVNGPSHILGMMDQIGMPEVFGYAVYIGEVLAPILVIIGLFTIPAALIIMVNMIFAIVLAHSHQLFSLTKSGGWALELQGMFLFGALAVALLGAGRYSAGGRYGKWN